MALRQMIEKIRRLLRLIDRQNNVLSRATGQNILGKVLSPLGRRESDMDRLKEAVVAHQDALKELTRKRDPLDWATNQYNLGNALRALGTRESGMD